MRYVSTRGAAPALAFDDVLLAGLARDGGLYVPESWPHLSAATLADLAGRPYHEIAFRVLSPFVGRAIKQSDLAALIEDAYRGFGHPAVAPLKQLAANDFLLELFHGPTLAFKDYALQVVGRLFDHVLRKKGARVTIVGATSGDTGSAAIEACRDRDTVDIFILHPPGPDFGGPTPADDDGQGRECPQHRARRDFRRLPGSAEGDVRGRCLS